MSASCCAVRAFSAAVPILPLFDRMALLITAGLLAPFWTLLIELGWARWHPVEQLALYRGLPAAA
jgi:hypothetical protein